MPTDERTLSLASLLVESINERYGIAFTLEPTHGGLVASDGGRQLGIHVAPLWEPEPGWDETLAQMEERLEDVGDGAYLLWVPPRASVPASEPDATYFVTRVIAAAEALKPGQRTEVTFPATIKLSKLRDEGGYASVSGGLSRWWTRITENVNGTFAVDSRSIHRLTSDGAAREELWQTIGRLSHGINGGQSGEFEIEDAWTLQRLTDAAAPGVRLIGAPPAVDPNDGILIRKMARKRLVEANSELDAVGPELRAVALLGAYEYMEVETASGTLKAIDPGLYARTQIVALVADGDVKPVFAPTAL